MQSPQRPNPNPQEVPETETNWQWEQSESQSQQPQHSHSSHGHCQVKSSPSRARNRVRVRVSVRVAVRAGVAVLVCGSFISMVQLSHIETLIASRLLGRWRPKAVIVLFHSWTPQLPKAFPSTRHPPPFTLLPAWLSRPLQLATLATAFAMITFGGC